MQLQTIHEIDLDRQLIARLKDSLLDAEIVVDDARRDLDALVVRLKSAVARRDGVAKQLEALIEKVVG